MSGAETIYQAVTDRMVSALEQGTVPWSKPWHVSAGLPASMSTGRPYRGINVFILGLAARAEEWSSPWFGTYKQISELGGQVRRGERSTLVVFWKLLRVPDRDSDQGKLKTIPLLKSFRVFNAEQADGLSARYYPGPAAVLPVADSAELIIKEYLSRPGAPSIASDGGDRAFYVPATDSIHLPADESFDSAAERYSTAFHEIGHSTGHESRLNRPGIAGIDHFGSDQYSREELVAEMASAMLCALSAVETDASFANSAGYIAGWLRVLKADTKLAVVAAGQAQKACDWITGTTYSEDEQP
jgi:antirestriction protein ArdC